MNKIKQNLKNMLMVAAVVLLFGGCSDAMAKGDSAKFEPGFMEIIISASDVRQAQIIPSDFEKNTVFDSAQWNSDESVQITANLAGACCNQKIIIKQNDAVILEEQVYSSATASAVLAVGDNRFEVVINNDSDSYDGHAIFTIKHNPSKEEQRPEPEATPESVQTPQPTPTPPQEKTMPLTEEPNIIGVKKVRQNLIFKTVKSKKQNRCT